MKLMTGCPSTSMDDYPLNMTSIIKHTAKTFPDREIVHKKSGAIERYSYGEAHGRMMKLANALNTLGVQPGDRVGVLDWNSHRHYELYYAIPGIGAVHLQLNLRVGPPDLAHVINHSQAKVLFVDESLLPLAESVKDRLDSVKQYVIMTDRRLEEVRTTLSPVWSYEDLLEKADAHYDWPMIEERSACAACYTSGTTGRPKGVYYSHRDMYLHTLIKALYLGYSCYDCFLQITPMFHAHGWGDIHCATFMGSKIVLPGRWTLEEIGDLVELIIQEEVTITLATPGILMQMLDYIKEKGHRPDFSNLRVTTGATEPPLAMMKEWKELIGAQLTHAYGATETSPIVTINLLKPSLIDKLSEEEAWELKKKQGFAVSGLEVKIVDAGGNEIPHDGEAVGEILIKGPWITGAYYNDPRTEESFVDGYWKSGDVATIDSEGYIKIVDRYKDLIKSGGEWISSVDLENEIMAHQGVLEATVVGLPHPKWEERPLALVVLRDEFRGKVSQEDILEFIRPKFAKWQLPNEIKFVDEIPKTSVGKFDKKEIRKAFIDEFVKET